MAARRSRDAARADPAAVGHAGGGGGALPPSTALAFGQVDRLPAWSLNFVAVPLMAVVQIGRPGAGGARHACRRPRGCRPAVVARLAARGITESARVVDVAPWAAPYVPPPAVWLAVLQSWCAGAAPGGCRTGAPAERAAAAWSIGPAARGSHRRRATVDGQSASALPLRRPTVPPAESAERLDGARGHGAGSASPSWTWRRAMPLLVRFPGRPTLLVDAGGAAAGSRFDVGARVVAPALWALGRAAARQPSL